MEYFPLSKRLSLIFDLFAVTGSLYQQCKCTSAVGCIPLSGSQTAVAPTSSFFYDTPLYCSSTPSINLCATSDACFNSATRSSCCISVQRIPQTISKFYCNHNLSVDSDRSSLQLLVSFVVTIIYQ